MSPVDEGTAAAGNQMLTFSMQMQTELLVVQVENGTHKLSSGVRTPVHFTVNVRFSKPMLSQLWNWHESNRHS